MHDAGSGPAGGHSSEGAAPVTACARSSSRLAMRQRMPAAGGRGRDGRPEVSPLDGFWAGFAAKICRYREAGALEPAPQGAPSPAPQPSLLGAPAPSRDVGPGRIGGRRDWRLP